MPKAEKGSLKDIGKKIKAKGLQKLAFYCQACEKQCRDANGFKCHAASDSHLRQMKLFSENAAGQMDQFSTEFCNMYLDTLRMRHGCCAQVNANNVYQQVIQDKHHVHMNATMWASLSDFCQYLGKTGKCVVEQNERGWYVTYIERNVKKLERQEKLAARQQAELVAEEVVAKRMQEQRVQAAVALDKVGGTVDRQATALERTDPDATIQLLELGILGVDKTKRKKRKQAVSVFQDDDGENDEEEKDAPLPPVPVPPPFQVAAAPSRSADPPPPSKKRSRPEIKAVKAPRKPTESSSPPPWLYRDIIVRIVNKRLMKGRYFKRKAAVDAVLKDDAYTARVTVLDSGPDQQDGGDVLELDQDDLETVIPKATGGKRVRVLVGAHRGKKATVNSLDKKLFAAELELSDGTVLRRVDYEHFSKMA